MRFLVVSKTNKNHFDLFAQKSADDASHMKRVLQGVPKANRVRNNHKSAIPTRKTNFYNLFQQGRCRHASRFRLKITSFGIHSSTFARG